MDNVTLSDKLDTIVNTFDKELTRVANTLALVKTINTNLRCKRPWYDNDMKQHKRRVRKLERKWLKYKLDSCWMAYKKCRNSYYGRLNAKKKDALKRKFAEYTCDTKKLHALVANLTTKQTPVQWPPHKMDEELAEQFVDYFQKKIAKICEALNNKPRYHTIHKDVPQLVSFAPMTEHQVLKAINSLKSKSCELDTIPTHILKQMMPMVLPLITKIVNISLTKGEFHRKWKTAIV